MYCSIEKSIVLRLLSLVVYKKKIPLASNPRHRLAKNQFSSPTRYLASNLYI